MIELRCPALGGVIRCDGQLSLPKRPPIWRDLNPAASLWLRTAEPEGVVRKLRLLYWCPGEGRVPEAVDAVVSDGKAKIAAAWQVMQIGEWQRSVVTRWGERVVVGDPTPVFLLETPYYVDLDT